MQLPRQIVFYLLVATYACACPLAIGYALGYLVRPGAAQGIVKTGLVSVASTPPGASGRVFGFVYSGLDLGSALTPLLFGWLLDRGAPRGVFLVSAAAMVLTIATVVQVRRHGPATAAARSSA